MTHAFQSGSTRTQNTGNDSEGALFATWNILDLEMRGVCWSDSAAAFGACLQSHARRRARAKAQFSSLHRPEGHL